MSSKIQILRYTHPGLSMLLGHFCCFAANSYRRIKNIYNG